MADNPTVERSVRATSTENPGMSAEGRRVAETRRLAREANQTRALEFTAAPAFNVDGLVSKARGKFQNDGFEPAPAPAGTPHYGPDQIADLDGAPGHTGIRDIVRRANLLLETPGGFAAIPAGPDKVALVADVRASILHQTPPEFSQYYQDPAHAAQLDAKVEQILNNPDFAREYRKAIADASDKEIPDAPKNQVKEAERQLREAEAALTAATNAHAQATAEQTAAFGAPGGAPGAYSAELGNLEGNEVNTLNELNNAQQALAAAPDRAAQQMAQTRIANAQTQIARLRSLREQRTQLQNSVNQKNAAETQAVAKRDQFQNEYFLARTRIRQSEIEYKEGFDQAAAVAVVDHLKKEYGVADAAQRKMLEAQAATTDDKFEKAVLFGLLDRWEPQRHGFLRRNPDRFYDRDMINRDYHDLVLDPNGATRLLGRVLREPFQNPTPPPPTITLTEAEITEKLKDKAWVSEQEKTLATKCVQERIQSGGRISAGEARMIEGTPWGQSLIAAAIEGKNHTDEVQAMLKANGIFEGDIRTAIERFRKEKGKDVAIAALLTAILGGIAVAALPVAPIIAAGGGAVAAGSAAAGGIAGFRGAAQNYARKP